MVALFGFDLALALVFAYFLATSLKPRTVPIFVVSFYVSVWILLVLAAEGLSLLHGLTPWGVAAAHFVLTIGGFLVWNAAGRPRPPRFTRPSWSTLRASVQAHPGLGALVACVGLAYAALALVNILVPPNNLDSLVYHLAKVAHWIQNRSLAPWPTPCLHQTLFPFNAEIGSLGSMIFLRSDALAGFTQWFAALAAAVAVFGMARVFGWSRTQSAFASALYLTLPMIALQATTTQNDLTTASLLAAAAFLLLSGLKTRQPRMLLLSGAALGLGLGTKLTVLMLIPGFGLAVAYLLFAARPRPVRLVLIWMASCAAGFIVLGAFNYVQSWVYLRQTRVATAEVARSELDLESDVAGPKTPKKPDILDATNLQAGPLRKFDLVLTRTNLARDIFSFLDLTGIPQPTAGALASMRARFARTALRKLLMPPPGHMTTIYAGSHDFDARPPVSSEAGSSFGLLGFFLYLPLVFYGLLAGWRRRDARPFGPIVFSSFLLILGATQSWTPFRGRYYVPVVTLMAPLAAALLGGGRVRTLLRTIVIVVSVIVLSVTTLTNIRKPLLGPAAIWTKSRSERRLQIVGQSGFRVRVIDREIPPGATVAAVLSSTDPEYLLFGERLTRRVVPIFPTPEVIDQDWLQRSPYDYFLIRGGKFRPIHGRLSSEFRDVDIEPYSIVIRRR